MAEVEYIVDGLEVAYEGVSNLNDFYEFIRSTLSSMGYNITEKEHAEKGEGNFSVKSKGERFIDDYTKFVLKVGISSSYSDVIVKGKKMQKGSFKLKIKALIERDYQGKWASPYKRFFRGVYDKYIKISKKRLFEQEIKEDVNALAEKAKRYFGMHKLS